MSINDIDLEAAAREAADLLSCDYTSTLDTLRRAAEYPHVLAEGVRQQANSPTASDADQVRQTEPTALLAELIASYGQTPQQRREAVLARLEAHWGHPSAVQLLDYGGGAGTNALFFAPACRHVAYYEASDLVADFAARRFAYRHLPIATVAETTTYGPEFDAVIALDGLARFADLAAHMREMVRLTKPGGMLFIAEPDASNATGAYAHPDPYVIAAAKNAFTDLGCQYVETVGGVHIFAKGPHVTVIVPVYNGREHVERLQESIKSTHPGYPVRWLFANDASPDEAIQPLLEGFVPLCPQPCRIIHHQQNLGFVRTCNAAMREVGGDDVILLNSDVTVYDGWVRRMVATAYADPTIATVTPLSNNASAFSVLESISPDNDLNAMLEMEDLEPFTVPTGVGFCMLIKREVLERVGLFDEIFGRGYGEETDLCCRAAAAGYRNVIATNVFIYHFGHGSMISAGVLTESQLTIPEHQQIVESRYPGYMPAVKEFVESGAIGKFSAYLAMRYILHIAAKRPAVMAVLHMDPFGDVIGGTEYHVADLARAMHQEYLFYLLYPDGKDQVRIAGFADGVVSVVGWQGSSYRVLFDALSPSLIHVHHLRGYAPGFVDALVAYGAPKVLTVHDYYGLCERFTLLDNLDRYCGVPQQSECDRCAKVLFGTGYETPKAHRRLYQRVVDAASAVLAPSETALSVFRRGVLVRPDVAHVIPHPIFYQSHRKVAPSDKDQQQTAPHMRTGELVVGIIGYDAPHKGSRAINDIVAQCGRDPVRFVALGNMSAQRRTSKVTTTGLYERDAIIDMIRDHKIDVMVVASPGPETFSYTVSESWEAGVPVIAGPFGAPAERIKQTGAGLVTSGTEGSAFVAQIRRLIRDPQLLAELKVRAASVTPTRDCAQYITLYSLLIQRPPTVPRLFSEAAGRDVGYMDSYWQQRAQTAEQTLAALRRSRPVRLATPWWELKERMKVARQ